MFFVIPEIVPNGKTNIPIQRSRTAGPALTPLLRVGFSLGGRRGWRVAIFKVKCGCLRNLSVIQVVMFNKIAPLPSATVCNLLRRTL